jgi:hypothetical protein
LASAEAGASSPPAAATACRPKQRRDWCRRWLLLCEASRRRGSPAIGDERDQLSGRKAGSCFGGPTPATSRAHGHALSSTRLIVDASLCCFTRAREYQICRTDFKSTRFKRQPRQASLNSPSRDQPATHDLPTRTDGRSNPLTPTQFLNPTAAARVRSSGRPAPLDTAGLNLAPYCCCRAACEKLCPQPIWVPPGPVRARSWSRCWMHMPTPQFGQIATACRSLWLRAHSWQFIVNDSSIGWFTPLFNARRRPFVRHLEPRQPRITGRLDAKAIAVRPPWSVALDVFKPVSGSGGGGGNDPRAEETPAAKALCVWQERVGIRQGRIGRGSSPCPMRRRSHGRTSPSRHRMRRPPRGLGARSANRRRGRRRWRST